MYGNEIIKTSEKSAIFSFTAVTYLSGIFLLWYAMRAKPNKRSSHNKQSIKSQSVVLPPQTVSSLRQKKPKKIQRKLRENKKIKQGLLNQNKIKNRKTLMNLRRRQQARAQ